MRFVGEPSGDYNPAETTSSHQYKKLAGSSLDRQNQTLASRPIVGSFVDSVARGNPGEVNRSQSGISAISHMDLVINR